MKIRIFIAVLAVVTLAAWNSPSPASAALTVGDTNCDGEVTTDDGLDILAYKARVGVGSECFQMANTDCDNDVDELDALVIFMWLADPVAVPGQCPGVGQAPATGTVYATTPYVDFGADGLDVKAAFESPGGDMVVGDTGGEGLPNAAPNRTRRVIISFPVGPIEGTIESATLTLAVTETRMDQYPDPGSVDGNAPYDNPLIGDVQVFHVGEPGTPLEDDYNAPSIGNDPGVLVANGAEGPSFKLSIDVTAALQQAIDENHDVMAFRLQTSILTDNDGLNDTWGFWSGNNRILDRRPTLRYELD